MGRSVAFAVAVLLVAPPVAGAQQGTVAPPGNAGLEQYLEAVPTAKGNQKARGPKSAGKALPAGTSSRLEASGKDGERLLQAVESSAPSAARDAASSRPGGSDGRADGTAGGSSESGSDGASADGAGSGAVGAGEKPAALSAVRDAVLGSSGAETGMGRLLPILLIGSALSLAGLALVRRARS